MNVIKQFGASKLISTVYKKKEKKEEKRKERKKRLSFLAIFISSNTLRGYCKYF